MLSNVKKFKLLRAKACHVVKQQKKSLWRNFCSELNSKTQTQKVWKTIRKIKGTGGSNSFKHLKVNSRLITDRKEMVVALAINLLKDSLTDNYSSKCQRIKMLKKTPGLLF